MRLLTQRFILLCLAGIPFLPLGPRAQVIQAPVKGFQYSEYDQATRNRKFLLTGESATNMSNVELSLTGARLEIYDDKGKTDLIVVSPQCRYHNRDKIVSSADKLQVTRGGGQFSIEGEGFEWRQADGRLAISNRVHAVLRQDLIGTEPTRQPSADSTVAGPHANVAAEPSQLIHIYSDRFQFRTNRAEFQRNVRVEEAQGKLTCGLLTATFSEPGRKIETILAEQDVVIDSGEIHATGEKATYRLAEDVVELKENPAWRTGAIEGQAEEVVFERSNRVFHASRNVVMTLPPGSLGTNGFLLVENLSATNAVAEEKRPVKVKAGDFDFRPDAANTNLDVAVFHGNVSVDAGKGKLTCGLMTITSSVRNHRTERMVAERGVVIEQEDSLVTSEKAIYTASTATVEMTGSPAWKVGDREGRADVLVFDVTNRAYQELRNVQMRLPPGAFGRSAWLLPKTPRQTGESATTTEAIAKEPARPIEVSSHDFLFKSASPGLPTDLAIYRGNVLVTVPGRMTVLCGTLTGRIAAGTNQVQSVVAENEVEIRVVDPKGDRVARGDRAVYTAGRDEVELTAAEGVKITLADGAGESRAQGRKAVYTGSEDIFELRGNPMVTTPKGKVTGDLVVFDRGKATLKATGYWKIRLRPEAFERPAPLPKGK